MGSLLKQSSPHIQIHVRLSPLHHHRLWNLSQLLADSEQRRHFFMQAGITLLIAVSRLGSSDGWTPAPVQFFEDALLEGLARARSHTKLFVWLVDVD